MLSLFGKIKAFVFDVDGVLTDGTLLLLPDGEMARTMNIKDGYALQLAVKQGYPVIIISGGNSIMVKERLERLGVHHVYLKVIDKKAKLLEILNELNVQKEETLFMGDDIPDIEAMEICGLPCSPADACQEVQAISHYVSHLNGGKGCGRDVIEKVLKLQGKWHTMEGVVSK